MVSTSSCHIPPGGLAPLPPPVASANVRKYLYLYLGFSFSRPGVNRGMVNRPGSGSGASHEGAPAIGTGISDGEG
jgi:hypothetical protein